MDQRHGVDHLDGAGRRHGEGLFPADELAGGDAEDGPDAFAAGEEGVAHRLVDLERLPEGDGGVQGSVDGVGFAEDVRHEVEGGGGFEVVVFFGDEGRGNGVGRRRNAAFWGEGDGFKCDEGRRSGSGCFGLVVKNPWA